MNLRKNDLQQMWDNFSQGYSQEFLNDILKPTGRGGVYASRDYISAICVLSELEKAGIGDRRSTLTKRTDIKQYLHPTTLFRLSSYSPMLAYRYDELKEPEKNKLFEDRDWLLTEKHNGIRIWVIHFDGVTKAYSRNYSQKDCSLPEYWGNILQECSDGEPFAFDAEIKYEPDAPLREILAEYGVATDSQLEAMASLLQMNAPQALEIQREYKNRFGKDLIVFRLISVLYYKGRNYKNRTIGEAYAVEKDFIRDIQARGINVQPIRKISGSREEKEAFLSMIIDDEHGEGGVFHHKSAKYCTSENRDKNGFVKIKRTVGAQAAKQGLGDTIDGWVTGFKLGTPGTDNEGLVSALEITTTIRKADGSTYDHVIAWVPNIELELKKQITVQDFDGNPTLDPEIYGLVAECTGQNISRVNKRLTHPRLVRFPVFDRTKFDCVYSEEFINSQIDHQES